jgi:hypothetical protein
MKILPVIFVIVLFFGFTGNVFAQFFNETASCSYGNCYQLDLSGTNLVPCYSRTYVWNYASQSCDFTSTRNQNNELVMDTGNLNQTLIYTFFAIMIVAFFVLILTIIVIPK